jgi:ADP-ribosylglycohydrolase
LSVEFACVSWPSIRAYFIGAITVPTQEDRLAGGLFGLLVGDALGVPYEFHAAASIPPPELIDFDPPVGFNRAHEGILPGTWSDDGAQALCLLASLLHCGAFVARDFANRLINWHNIGYMAVDGDVFDIGVQTSQAIARLRAGAEPLEAGGIAPDSQGNGSLMRVLPLALWHRGSDDMLVHDAHAQSRITHGHVTVQSCCALYCLWARRTLEGATDPWNDAVASLRSVYRDLPLHRDALENEIQPDKAHNVRGTGFVVDCLFSAKASVAAGPYETAVKAAISLGQDTDTTACVAGGIAGVRDGIGAIPMRWRDRLRGRDEADKLLEKLLSRSR